MALKVGLALLLTGCGGEDRARTAATEPPPEESPAQARGEYAIVAGTPGEFDFDLPASVPAGEYEFILTNEGEQFHHAQIYRLQDGVTFADFQDTLISSAETGFNLPQPVRDLVVVPPTGVTRNLSPGEEARAMGSLEPGIHAVVCFLLDIGESATPHYALGMLAELEVA